MTEKFLTLSHPVFIASDHGGFELKQKILNRYAETIFKNLGPEDSESVDYPDYATKLCEELLKKLDLTIEKNPNVMGILICGSGQGMAMTANKFEGIRAALCWSKESAQLARSHNNANVLCLGARLIRDENSLEIIETFLSTPFEGGRHLPRINKIKK